MSSRRRQRSRDRGTVGIVLRAAGTLAVVALLLILGATAHNGIPGMPHYTVRAEFDDLNNLGANAEVRLGGRRVGQALHPRLEDGEAVIDLQLDDDVEPLPSDSTVRIRERSMLGRRYLEINPGSSTRPLSDGGTIPSSQTSASVQVPEILDALDERTREGLATTLGELGEGFLGRGAQLNAALPDAYPLLRDQADLAAAIVAREGAATRFFPAIESAAAAADPVREEIAQGFDPQARALRPLADHRTALQDLLEEAPAALPEVRAGLARTDPLLIEMSRFLRASRRLARPAPAAFAEASALLAQSRAPLRRARPLLERAGEVVPSVLAFTDRIDPEIGDARAALRDSIPGLRELADHACDVIGMANNWRSMLGYGSVSGAGEIGPLNVFRLQAIVNAESVRGPAEPIDRNFGSDPYPEPCLAGTKELP